MRWQTRELPDRVVLEPAVPAEAAVVWLHGLGADGWDFVPIVGELGLNVPIRFVFPHAPIRPVTINGGVPMRAWYDIVALSADGPEDEAGIRASASRVAALLDEQRDAGIDSRRMVLAGFSQGGAMALHSGLRYPQPLAGILALSTYLPLRDRWQAEQHPANRDTPILMMHGRFDPVLPIALGAYSRDLLRAGGRDVDWREYPMQHQVCPQQIADIAGWLADRLGR